MDPRSFTLTYDVDRTPAEVSAAIRDVRSWWSGQIDGPTGAEGDEFVYQFEDVHRSKMRVAAVTPNRIEWDVLETTMTFVEDQEEWVGTRVIFEFEPLGAGTRVTFTHDGLVPEFECFEACQQGWTMYASNSLRALLTSGSGNPNGDGAARTDMERTLLGHA